ncbi:MAG: protein-L-isoaspartate(D-aspartate) O-methyltransferase [Candidatus Ryanbacteria bacterium]|nr:protein-L-isoaspartate(D-aspartate) O-methyltransferase [Candidatus Ryanbacteria bacterium]
MDELVKNALGAIDRKDFVPKEFVRDAYKDIPLPIGHGQTISQPYTVAFMLELLDPKAGNKILDVGSGSGWTTALLAHIVWREGAVFGVERVQELADFGKKNLEKYKFAHASIEKAGKALGLPKKAPFDRILVSAASSELPQELVDQLAIGGIMVIPIGDTIYKIIKKSEGEITREAHHGFVFVPLVR